MILHMHVVFDFLFYSLSIMYLLFLPYPVSGVFRGFLGIPLPAKTSGLTEAVMHTVAPY